MDIPGTDDIHKMYVYPEYDEDQNKQEPIFIDHAHMLKTFVLGPLRKVINITANMRYY